MLFELEAIGGPLARRLARRRGRSPEWQELLPYRDAPESERARLVWTQSAFSEYASAASFAEITAGLLASGAPIDLVAAAGDFIVDELVHVEMSASLAMAFGGAVPLEVDLERLVRPPTASAPLVRVAELIVRTCCVGESLTVELLQASKQTARAPVVVEVLSRILRDEAEHAELGWSFLDWAEERLSEADRTTLGRAATTAIESFAPIFSPGCSADGELGALNCAAYDAAFAHGLSRRVEAPLRERGVILDPSALERLRSLANAGDA